MTRPSLHFCLGTAVFDLNDSTQVIEAECVMSCSKNENTPYCFMGTCSSKKKKNKKKTKTKKTLWLKRSIYDFNNEMLI